MLGWDVSHSHLLLSCCLSQRDEDTQASSPHPVSLPSPSTSPPNHQFNFFSSDNYPKPGKRPLSSTSPLVIEDEHGEFFAATGASGGSRIFPAVFQALVNLDWGLDASAAVEYGRVHDQLFPTFIDADNVYPEELLDGLRDRGHNVSGRSFFKMFWNVVGKADVFLAVFSCGYWTCCCCCAVGDETG